MDEFHTCFSPPASMSDMCLGYYLKKLLSEDHEHTEN